MQRRAQEVIDRCWQHGRRQPDPVDPRRRRRRAVERAARAGARRRRRRHVRPARGALRGARHVAARDLVQRGAGALRAGDRAGRASRASPRSASASACPFAVVGPASADGRLVVAMTAVPQPAGGRPARGDPRQAAEDDARRRRVPRTARAAVARSGRPARGGLPRPAVPRGRRQDVPGDDRRPHRGRACARATRWSGPWQVPVADVAVTLADFTGYAGEAMAMGERTPLALIDAPASGRIAVAEAITNLAAAPVATIDANQAVCELDGARGTRGRGRRALRHRARGERVLHRARRLDSGRQGLDVDAHDVARCRRRPRRDRARIARRVGVRADRRRAATRSPRCCALDKGPTSRSCCSMRAVAGGASARSALAQVYGQLGDESPDVSPRDLAALFAVVQEARRDGSAARLSRRRRRRPVRDAGRDGIRVALRPRDHARRHRHAAARGAVRRGDRRGRAGRRRRHAGTDRRGACSGAPGVRRRRAGVRATGSACAPSSTSCWTRRAWTCIARGPRRRTHCSACATIRGLADEEYDRLLDAAEPPMPASVTFDPDRGPRGPVHRERRAPARSRSCASRA